MKNQYCKCKDHKPNQVYKVYHNCKGVFCAKCHKLLEIELVW